MPINRLAVLAGVQTAQSNTSTSSSSSTTSTSIAPVTGGNYYYQLPGYNVSGSGDSKFGRFETDLHGNVNVLLGGAMLSGVIVILVLVCYCCHKSVQKNRPQQYSQYWRGEPDIQSLEVFTMDAHSMYNERSGNGNNNNNNNNNIDDNNVNTMSLSCDESPGPPPTYESLIFNLHNLPSPNDKKEERSPIDIIIPLTTIINNNININGTSAIENDEQDDDNGDDNNNKDEDGLPTYEAALKFEANGYV